MNKKKIIIPLLILILLFFIIKLFLNFNGLEFMSYIYYVFASFIFIYLIICSIILFKKEKNKIVISILIEIMIFIVVLFIMSIVVGKDTRVNNDIVRNSDLLSFKDDKIGYKYINLIVRGNEPIHCSMELCEKRPIDK